MKDFTAGAAGEIRTLSKDDPHKNISDQCWMFHAGVFCPFRPQMFRADTSWSFRKDWVSPQTVRIWTLTAGPFSYFRGELRILGAHISQTSQLDEQKSGCSPQETCSRHIQHLQADIKAHHDFRRRLRIRIHLVNAVVVFVFLPGAEVHRVFRDVAGKVCTPPKKQAVSFWWRLYSLTSHFHTFININSALVSSLVFNVILNVKRKKKCIIYLLLYINVITVEI